VSAHPEIKEPIGRLQHLVEVAELARDRPSTENIGKAKRTWDRYLRNVARFDASEIVVHPDYMFLIARMKGIDREWTARANSLILAVNAAIETTKTKAPHLRLVNPLDEETDRELPVWQRLQKATKNGHLVAGATLSNIAIILDNDTRWAGKVRLNTFARKVEVNGEMITDSAVLQAAIWMDRTYGMSAGKMAVQDAMTVTAAENPYNPIADYLNGLKWDGKPRCPHLFTGYIVGKVNNEEHRTLLNAFGVRWMISAVARIMEPGCKVDTLPVLFGAKGVKKSSAFLALAGDPRWFADTALDPTKKDAMEQLQGVWIYEWSEFDIWLKKRGENRIRNFLSRAVDHFRWTHAINVEDYPRQGAFVASTNVKEFITDPERRFWPVEVQAADLPQIRADRDQLWAEAVHRYKAGTQWHLTPEEEALLVTSSTDFEEPDPWEDLIARTLEGPVFLGALKHEKMPHPFSISQLFQAMGFGARDMTKEAENRAGQCLRALGYLKSRKRDGSGRSWVWDRPE
jgi:putative DNA primase/helicase